MAAGLIDDFKAWVVDAVGPKLRVTIAEAIEGSFTPSGLNVALKITNSTVTTTAAKIPLTPLSGRNSMAIENRGTNSIYIGNSDVTASGSTQGWEIPVNGGFNLDITDNIEIYAICASGTVDVKILELA